MVGRGIRGQQRCAARWVGFHNSASPGRRERAVAARSSSALPECSTREKPVGRKGEGPETKLLRDHGKQSTTMRKRKSRKVNLVSRVWGNFTTSFHLDWGSLPSLSSPKPPAYAAWYTCPRCSGGATVVTGQSVEVAVGVASKAVRAPMGWSWAAPFVRGTHRKNWIAIGGRTSSAWFNGGCVPAVLPILTSGE